MATVTARAIKWLLVGGAFLVVASHAGCSRLQGLFRAEPATAAPSVAETQPVAEIVPAAPDPVAVPAPAPAINIFGELDGQARPPVRMTGQSGFQQHTSVTDGRDADVAVDPAGKWLAFSSTRHSENASIYLQRCDGTSVIQLTDDRADDAFPTFSPDGKQIAFCSTRSGDWDIYLMDVDGRNLVQVTSGGAQDLHPSFSPDGTRLVYCSLGPRSEQWELWVVHLASGRRQMVGQGLFPAWSPSKEGDRIAFQRARQRGSRWFSVWTLDLVDGEARRVTEVAVSTNAAVVTPCWSPDGRRLAFASIVDPARVGRDGRPMGQQDIWTMDADGRNRHRLTDGRATNLTPSWAVDNRVYFVSDRGGSECVWSVKADRKVGEAIAGTAAEAAPTAAPATGAEVKKDAPASTPGLSSADN